MINEFKGAPGVLPEKLAEGKSTVQVIFRKVQVKETICWHVSGMQVQHCALSLVGEPIMYPEINKYVKLLHSKVFLAFNISIRDHHLSQN